MDGGGGSGLWYALLLEAAAVAAGWCAFCIKMDAFCIKTDEFCVERMNFDRASLLATEGK